MYDYSSVLTVNFYIAPVIYPTCHGAGLVLDFGCFLVGLFFFLSLRLPFLSHKLYSWNPCQSQSYRQKNGWVSVQKCMWLSSSETVPEITYCKLWLKIFEMFTGCIIYMFDILKETSISCAVTIPEKRLKRTQAKSQSLICSAVSNLKANSSLTYSRFCAGGSKPSLLLSLPVKLCHQWRITGF